MLHAKHGGARRWTKHVTALAAALIAFPASAADTAPGRASDSLQELRQKQEHTMEQDRQKLDQSVKENQQQREQAMKKQLRSQQGDVMRPAPK